MLNNENETNDNKSCYSLRRTDDTLHSVTDAIEFSIIEEKNGHC